MNFSFVNQRAFNDFCQISKVLLLLAQGSLIEIRIIPISGFKD